MQITNRGLLQQALAGDVRAFEMLVERHFGLVYTVAYSRLGDSEIAEDLAQEVMLRAYLHLERLGPDGNFSAWVARIARNLAIDWLRRGQRVSRLLPQVPLDEVPLSTPNPTLKGACETMSRHEESEALRSALFDLPDADRELVLLHFTEGLSQSEIAERLGTTQATVSRRLKAALGKLRGQLEPMLREVAPLLRAPQRAVVRSVAFIAAASALSATAKAGLIAAAPATEIASETSAAKAGAMGAAGVIGFLQSLPALIAGGSKIMITGKGLAVTVAAVATVTLGGVHMATRQKQETLPAISLPATLESAPDAPTRPGPAVLPLINLRDAHDAPITSSIQLTMGTEQTVLVPFGEAVRLTSASSPGTPQSSETQIETLIAVDSWLIHFSTQIPAEGFDPPVFNTRTSSYELSMGRTYSIIGAPFECARWSVEEGVGVTVRYLCDEGSEEFAALASDLERRIFEAGDLAAHPELSQECEDLVRTYYPGLFDTAPLTADSPHFRDQVTGVDRDQVSGTR